MPGAAIGSPEAGDCVLPCAGDPFRSSGRAASARTVEPLLAVVLVNILKGFTKYNFSVNFLANKSVFEHLTVMCKCFTGVLCGSLCSL